MVTYSVNVQISPFAFQAKVILPLDVISIVIAES